MFKKIKKLESEVADLRKQLYENLDTQKIKEFSKKYNIKIEFESKYLIMFEKTYNLKINNCLSNSKNIKDKHEYIQSEDFEKDIKIFLYDRQKRKK